eukprot:jgi/Hompol1/6158/HPOL_002195-RA
MSLAVPVQPAPLGMRTNLALRLPVLIGAIALLARFWDLLIYPEHCATLASSSFMMFFVLHCYSYITDILISVLETGRNRIEMHQQDPPAMFEWATSLYFSHQQSTGRTPLVAMAIIHMLEISIKQVLGISRDLDRLRLIPSAFAGIAEVVHMVWWTFVMKNSDYPSLFWMAQAPQVLIMLFVVSTWIVSSIAWLILGDNMQPNEPLFEGITLRDDYSMVLRKLSSLMTRAPPSSSLFSHELEPIVVGLPPAELIHAPHTHMAGYRLNLDEIEMRKPKVSWYRRMIDSNDSSTFSDTAINSIRLWESIITIVLMPRHRDRATTEDDGDDTEDPDYVLDKSDAESTSDTDSSEGSDHESYAQECGHEEDEDETANNPSDILERPTFIRV